MFCWTLLKSSCKVSSLVITSSDLGICRKHSYCLGRSYTECMYPFSHQTRAFRIVRDITIPKNKKGEMFSDHLLQILMINCQPLFTYIVDFVVTL